MRVVELIDSGSNNNWDAHGDMRDHRPKALRVDRAIAGLLKDLKQRGLLDQTLVAICTEFGRTPWTDGPNTKGRNHYAKAFSSLLAGAGVKGGFAFGETDEFGINIAANPVHVHDYHATILHLMGIDHTRLVYRYAGRDFRLTDVDGEVVTQVLDALMSLTPGEASATDSNFSGHSPASAAGRSRAPRWAGRRRPRSGHPLAVGGKRRVRD